MKHLEYFYIPPNQITGDIVEFKGQELKHLVIVARKKLHDIVQVVDGRGNVYTIQLNHITKTSATGVIQKRSRYSGEPNFQLTLAQAIPKGNRFDWAIEKGTEIGVSKFIPLITERSIVQGSEVKLKRWEKVAIAAMKQCTRSILPPITPPQTLDQILSGQEIYDFRLIAHPADRSKSLAELIIQEKQKFVRISKIRHGIILVGPEGGFTAAEVQQAETWNYQCFTLGQRRLRSETAGIVAASLVMELVDNWS